MSDKKLNLSPDKIEKSTQKQLTPEDAAREMASFYSIMGDCALNLVPIMDDIAKTLQVISLDLSDHIFYQKKIALKMEAVTEIEIQEQEQEDDEEPPLKPANA